MRTLALVAIFGFSACTTTAAIIPDGPLTTGDPDLDPDADPDPDPDPTSEFEGEWTSGLTLVGDLGRGPQPLCFVEFVFDVNDEGDFDAAGDCPLQFGGGGGGGRASYAVTLEGEFRDDGEIKAEVTWERSAQWMGELDDTKLVGEAELNSGYAFGDVLIDLGWTESDGVVEVEFKR
ncbi:MAG: hypothetical protein AB8H79_05895 [Myxococcota bacterium]